MARQADTACILDGTQAWYYLKDGCQKQSYREDAEASSSVTLPSPPPSLPQKVPSLGQGSHELHESRSEQGAWWGAQYFKSWKVC